MPRDLNGRQRFQLGPAAHMPVAFERTRCRWGPAPRLRAPASGVAVPDVDPARSVASQNAADLAKSLRQLGDVEFRRFLEPDLGINPGSAAFAAVRFEAFLLVA